MCVCVCVKVAQLCPTLCDPMDYTVHGILQARIIEWLAFPFSRGSFQPRDKTQISRIAWILLLCFTINEGNFLSSRPHKVWPARKRPILPPVRFTHEPDTSLFSGRLCKICLDKVSLSSLKVSGHIWLHEPHSLIWYLIYSIKYSSRIWMLIAV